MSDLDHGARALLDGDGFDDDDPREPELLADESLLGVLRAQRATIAERHTLEVEVPGWRGLLGLRLGAISGAQQARLFERVQKAPTAANVDTILAAFQRVLGRPSRQEPWQVLADAESGEPLKLDEVLAERLGIVVVENRARLVLSALFEGANSPGLAIAAVAYEYMEWARESTDEVDEEFAGES